MVDIEERTDEEEIAIRQQWHDAMKRQVHNIIVSTLEALSARLKPARRCSTKSTQTLTLTSCASN
jgi:hypothetical protein